MIAQSDSCGDPCLRSFETRLARNPLDVASIEAGWSTDGFAAVSGAFVPSQDQSTSCSPKSVRPWTSPLASPIATRSVARFSVSFSCCQLCSSPLAAHLGSDFHVLDDRQENPPRFIAETMNLRRRFLSVGFVVHVRV